jgi:hypothetical protein
MFVEEMKNPKEWEDFVEVTPGGTFYHNLKWKEVIQRSFNHSPLYLAVMGTGGRLLGICPGFILNVVHLNAYCSMPYSDYGGPVISSHFTKQASRALLSFLQSFCLDKGIAYSKICLMDNDLARCFESSASSVDSDGGVIEIDLEATPPDFIWNKLFSASTRRRIRLVERGGFQAQEARTKSDLRDFYFLYYKNMKYIGGSPHNYEFMNNLWEILYPENLRIWIVGNRRRIGGITVFTSGRGSYWAYAGIDREYAGKYSIIPYLLWKEITKAKEEGRRYLSLGSTSSDPGNPNHLQKIGLGGIFYQQRTMWYPIGSTGRIMIRSRTRAVSAWKAIRGFLPNSIESFLENRLSKL